MTRGVALRRNSGLMIFLMILSLLTTSVAKAQDGVDEKASGNYKQTLYVAGRFVLGFGLLVGAATTQSAIGQRLSSSPLLCNAVNYVFTPLTVALSMLTITPLQSWVGKYIHGAFAPPESVSEKTLPEDGLEGLWYRTYQSYSMNAQMSRNVVLALNTLSFFYLDRVQKFLEAGQIEAGLYTQIHFFRMAERYFAEIPFQSPIWEDVFIPHAKIIWDKYKEEAVRQVDKDDLSESAFELFTQRILNIENGVVSL